MAPPNTRKKRKYAATKNNYPIDIIRSFLPPHDTVLSLKDFIQRYTPALECNLATPIPNTTNNDVEGVVASVDQNEQQQQQSINLGDGIFVSPSKSLKSIQHLKHPTCREPLPSLVDDIIRVLVQRRERLRKKNRYYVKSRYDKSKKNKKGKNDIMNKKTSSQAKNDYDDDGQNVLVVGYALASTQNSNLTTTGGPEITCLHPNENVSFCKSSRLMRTLHCCVGDEVLRMVLLHTRLFVPVDGNENCPAMPFGGNFILISGSPIPLGRRKSLVMSNKKKRSLKADDSPDTVNNRQKTNHLVEPAATKEETRLHPNATISRYSMFYSDKYIPKIGLPQKHPFNRYSSGCDILHDMINFYTPNGNKRRKRWSRLHHQKNQQGISICNSILLGHKRCDYARKLNRYCKLPDRMNKTDGKRSSNSIPWTLQELTRQHVPAEKVVSFITAVLKDVFPETFWGHTKNFDCIVGTVETFVNLRRQEKLSNKVLMHGLRVTKIKWLFGNHEKGGKALSKSNHEASVTLTLEVMRWLFRSFIIPLIRSNFYATETEFSKQRILFYRKPIWSIFRSLSMKKLLKGQYKELSGPEAATRIQTQHIGFSRLRLLPKATGVRPIADLSRWHDLCGLLSQAHDQNRVEARDESYVDETGKIVKRRRLTNSINTSADNRPTTTIIPKCHRHAKQMSPNARLRHVFEVLKYELGRSNKPYGSGMEGLNDFHSRYRDFIVNVKEEFHPPLTLRLHFASVDIEKCYDNIDQHLICDLAKKYVSNPDYVIQKIALLYSNRSSGAVGRLTKSFVCPPEKYDLVQNGRTALSRKYRQVLFDAGKCTLVQNTNILNLLTEHLQNNLVVASSRYGNRVLHQTRGISQGSVLSTMLCNLYYGSLEDTLLQDNTSPAGGCSTSDTAPGLLCRLVDDFIFISTSNKSVDKFLKQMSEGKPELGVKINKEKTVVSGTVAPSLGNESTAEQSIDGGDSNDAARAIRQTAYFPWCGLLFDTSTGEVSLDYGRFHNPPLKDRITVERNGNEGTVLCSKMKNFVRPRCQPLLYDSSINKYETIAKNFYQMIVLAAAFTVEYIRGSQSCQQQQRGKGAGGRRRVESNGRPLNTKFIVKSVSEMLSYAVKRIITNLKRCNATSSTSPGNTFLLVSDHKATSWLCWKAFYDVFHICCSASSTATTPTTMTTTKETTRKMKATNTEFPELVVAFQQRINSLCKKQKQNTKTAGAGPSTATDVMSPTNKFGTIVQVAFDEMQVHKLIDVHGLKN